MRRLLVYSQDGLGLGHLRRTRNIAQEVMADSPGCRVLVVGDSPAIPLFPQLPGIRHVRLPTLVKRGPNAWSSIDGSPPQETIDRRIAMLLAIYEHFSPDGVLVDHMPAGAWGELAPLLDLALHRARRPRLFLGLRDILDHPEVIRTTWAQTGGYDYLQQYDRVLVYGDPDVFDAQAAYDLGEHARDVRFCGYVTLRDPPVGRPFVGTPHVVAMGGGGADAWPLADTFLAAVRRVLRERPVSATVLTGPNMSPHERASLRARAVGLPVRVAEGLQDAPALVARASAVVSMAGYNSTCEAVRARKPALLVPRRGPSAEQRMRASVFAGRGLVSAIHPEELAPDTMAAAIDELLARAGRDAQATLPSFDGARVAAAAMTQRVAVAA